VIWETNMRFDPVGATWGPGVVRSRTQTVWGWNAALAAEVQAPSLLMSGELDMEASPQAVRDLHADLGSSRKVFVSIACTSHYVPYETQRELLHNLTLHWLLHGSIKGFHAGALTADAQGRLFDAQGTPLGRYGNTHDR
jgi:pimeloyl-ACP methyl ester carboxylesterase